MKLIVNPHTIEIVKDLVNEKEIDVTKCEFEFADEITDDYVKEAYFTYNGTTYKQIIQNNECKIPYEVLENKGMVEIGVVCYKLENDEYVKRYNPSPAYFNSLIGSLKEEYENSEPVTPTDKEQIEQALNDGLNDIQSAIDEVDNKIIEVNNAIEETNNLNIDVNKVDKEATIELTKKDGTQKEVKIYDGVSLQFMWQGTSLGIKTDDMQDYVFVNLQGIQGIPGPQGEPFRIKKTYSSVAEMNADFNNMNYGDYVMIASTVEVEDNAKLYTRGELQWIFITDFSGATGIKGETGATPNIQIGNVTSGDTPNVTRTGTNENPILNFTLVKGDKGNKGDKGDIGLTGNGISNISKTGTSGLVDTYTITYTNGQTTTYQITNGEDGEVTQEQLDKVQAELDYYKMLENALPKVEGEGESITLDNTAKCPMKLGFKGQIQQDSTTGTNLISLDTQQCKVSLNAGDYIVAKNETSNDLTLNLYTNYGDSTRNDFWSVSANNFRKISVGYNTGAIKWTSTPDGLAWVNAGETSLPYEPYTGGSPSPSPSYPQDIHIVSGDNTIKVEGRNRLNYTLFVQNNQKTYTSSGVTATINDDGTITLNGTATANKDFYMVNNGVKTSNHKLVLFAIDGTFTGNTSAYAYTSGSQNGKHADLSTLGTSEVNLTSNLDYTSFEIYVRNGNVYNNARFGIMVVDKDLTINTYEPYKGYTKEINLPVENLFDKNNVVDNSYYETNGDISSSNNYFRVDNYTYCYNKGNLTISGVASQGSGQLIFYDENKNYVDYYGFKNRTLAIPNNVYYYRFASPKTNKDTIQIEFCSKANSYTPYGTTPIELGKIGNYEDEFFKNTIDSEYYDSTLELDKWYLKKRIGKVVLDGSETWGILETTFGYRFRTTLSNSVASGTGNVNSYCSHFILGSTYNDKNVYAISDTGNLNISLDENYTTISQFKTWLNTHNTIVYYVLATPTNILLNDTLQATLDSFYSWQEQTNISQENNDLPFVIKASAIRDMTKIYDI